MWSNPTFVFKNYLIINSLAIFRLRKSLKPQPGWSATGPAECKSCALPRSHLARFIYLTNIVLIINIRFTLGVESGPQSSFFLWLLQCSVCKYANPHAKPYSSDVSVYDCFFSPHYKIWIYFTVDHNGTQSVTSVSTKNIFSEG